MLARVFAGRKIGFYVDVGAADPINLSVTKWFYDLGWRGLNIEPNRELFDRLKADRPDDINLNCGVGAVAAFSEFAEVGVGELSSFDPMVKRTADKDGLAVTKRLVQVFPLTVLLEKYCAGRSIDFLKVDVEGWEFEVFRGLDLAKFRPAVILAEATIPRTRIASYSEWETLLIAANYYFVYFDGVNRYYLAREHLELKLHFDSPPNAFDEFETFPLVRAKTDAEQRLQVINDLQARLVQTTNDANLRLEALQKLEALLATATTDAALRLVDNQKLEAIIRALELMVAKTDAKNIDLKGQNELLAIQLGELRADLVETNASLDRVRESLICQITHPRWQPSISRVTTATSLTDRFAPTDTVDSGKLRTVVVDLTPILPGGENGGAKVFVLELLRRLADLAPRTQFVLLTQAAAHEELASLDRPNVRRVMVLDLVNPPVMRSLATRVSSRLVHTLPGRLGRVAQREIDRIKHLAPKSAASVTRQLGADLLFCPFTAPTYFEPGVPTVSVIYDLQYKTYPSFFAPADVAQRERTFQDAARRASSLVAISEYSRQTAIEHGGLDPERIKTVHLHISKHSLQDAPRDDTILERLRLVAGQYLIYPANFWKHKNHEMLLTAFGIARSNGLDGNFRLVCTGAPGERQRWLQAASTGLGLGEHVLFPGYLATAELLSLTSSSAGVIFPSLYEGFGLPVIEAMASGVPVACSNLTSLPEVAGDAAILFDPRIPDEIAAAMIALAQDKTLTARLVQSGAIRVRQFSNSRLMAQQYWEVFQQAVGLEIRSDMLIGVYPDGWLGPNSRVQVASGPTKRTLEIEFAVPGWAPASKVKMQIRQAGRKAFEVSVSRGANGIASVALPKQGGLFDISLTPAFVPAQLDMGDDKRQLSASLVRCEIIDADGQRVALSPEILPT